MMATNNGNYTGNSKGKGIQPGSLVMLRHSTGAKNPSCGKIFTAIRKESNEHRIDVHPTEKSSDAWVLDKPIHLWFPTDGWVFGYNGPVPSKFLIPLNDPDAEPEQEDKEKEKDKNLCEST